MAITGYEHDQVMVRPAGRPGANPDADVSVPMNWAYNHHYQWWLTGSHSEMLQVPAEPGDAMAHGGATKWIAVDRPSAALRADASVPTGQYFSEGNGGESRKSYHGYPKGFAQLIDSPTMWHTQPMQIDTRNRDCGVRPEDVGNCTTFVPGPEPKQARYGRGASGASNSGILECPCNERFGGDPIFYPDAKTKLIERKFKVLSSGSCGDIGSSVASAAACFAAVPSLGINATFENRTISDPALPLACSVVLQADGRAIAYYNSDGQAECPSGHTKTGTFESKVGVTFSLELTLPVGSQADGTAKITMAGPADAWFGVGLNAYNMADSPYTLVASESGVIEQKIGTCGSEAEHCPGDQLAASVQVVSNTAVDGVRTVVLTRGLVGLTADHYTFDAARDTLEVITAVGSGQALGYHLRGHDQTAFSLVAMGSATCVCDLGSSGSLCMTDGTGCQKFQQNCFSEEQGGDLLAQQNPTCNSEHYSGGLRCCSHKRIVLDVAQAEESLQRDVLRYHMKIRVWFKELTVDPSTRAPSHVNLERIYYQTEANAGEYDVPPAFARPGLPIPGYPDQPLGLPTPGTSCTGTCPGPDCECEHTITFRWTLGDIRLLYAGGHCHAPSCLSLDLYVNQSGTLTVLCAQRPKYGTGDPDDRFDELGYLAIPPCLWSDDPAEGLQPSVWLPRDTHLVSVKKNRNTHMGHYGEMASWQMRGVSFPSATTLI